jgi:hypothetical protein
MRYLYCVLFCLLSSATIAEDLQPRFFAACKAEAKKVLIPKLQKELTAARQTKDKAKIEKITEQIKKVQKGELLIAPIMNHPQVGDICRLTNWDISGEGLLRLNNTEVKVPCERKQWNTQKVERNTYSYSGGFGSIGETSGGGGVRLKVYSFGGITSYKIVGEENGILQGEPVSDKRFVRD